MTAQLTFILLVLIVYEMIQVSVHSTIDGDDGRVGAAPNVVFAADDNRTMIRQELVLVEALHNPCFLWACWQLSGVLLASPRTDVSWVWPTATSPAPTATAARAAGTASVPTAYGSGPVDRWACLIA